MSVFKQVHMKFWQNDFVLGLTAEERYFYIYLITNSMTTQCGIYKFNRRLAELETGYSTDKIEELLKKFQDYGKLIVSQSSTEIMLVNWFKHNFKSNKRAITIVNKELRDVKDKSLLKLLYNSCNSRQYPVAEIFNRITVPGVEIEKLEPREEILPQASVIIQQDANISSNIQKESEVSAAATENSIVLSVPAESDSSTFIGFKKSSGKPLKRKERKKEKPAEELVSEECSDEDTESIADGTLEAFWSFAADAGSEGCGEVTNINSCSISAALLENTA